MFTKINLLVKKILIPPRIIRTFLVMTLDFSLCILCTWLAFYLRFDQFISIQGGSLNCSDGIRCFSTASILVTWIVSDYF